MQRLSPLFSFFLIPLLVTLPLNAQVPGGPGASTSAMPEALQIRVIDANTGSIAINSKASKGLTVEVTDSEGAPVSEAAVALRLPDAGPTGAFADGSHAAVAYTDRAGRAQIASVKWGDTPGVVAMRLTTVKGTAHAGILVEQILTAVSSVAPSPAVVSANNTPTNTTQKAPMPFAQLATAAPVSTQSDPAPKHSLSPAAPPLKPEPAVSVTNAGPPDAQHHSHKKWIVIAAIAAGAGAGLAFAGKGKSSAPAAPASSLSIGSPTVSVGHP